MHQNSMRSTQLFTIICFSVFLAVQKKHKSKLIELKNWNGKNEFECANICLISYLFQREKSYKFIILET